MMQGEHISQEDLALYAMQALSPEEALVVRMHLAECALCRAELAEVSGDLSLVAMSVEQHPVPEGARQRFLDKVSAESQSATQQAVALLAAQEKTPRRMTSLSAWISWVAVAALVVAVVSLNRKVTSLTEQLSEQSSAAVKLEAESLHAQQVLEVLTAPKAQRATLTASKIPAVPTGRAVYLADRGALILQASNLEPLPEAKTYELWVIPADGASPMPAGLFRPDATGSASLVLPPLPKGIPAKAFAITIEKAEGSNVPTAPIILSGAASSGA
jgi:anti-sigma factor RsiW